MRERAPARGSIASLPSQVAQLVGRVQPVAGLAARIARAFGEKRLQRHDAVRPREVVAPALEGDLDAAYVASPHDEERAVPLLDAARPWGGARHILGGGRLDGHRHGVAQA
jgi:hypothetical protein